MIRECTLEDISDGRTYGLNDMVKADTGNCAGCFKCCTGMGTSIVLDPYDVCQIKAALNKSFQELLDQGYIELNMVDGLILPNLKMNSKNRCGFLSDEGRCTIHQSRPGICRIFPLGRVYDGQGFKYFLQNNQCVKDNRAKIKVKKWIDAKCLDTNQEFVKCWHYFIRDIGEKITGLKKNNRSESINDIAMFILNSFYIPDIASEKLDSDEHAKELYELLLNRIDKAKKIIEDTFA